MSDHSLKTAHDAFKSLRIRMGRTPSSQDFMSFVHRINNRSAVQITHDFLNELQRFKKSGLIEELTSTVKDVKTFLSAFMIVDNREDIFSVIGEKETILYNSAKEMVITFEALCSIIHDQQDDVLEETVDLHNCLDSFHDDYKLYVAAFTSWKSNDLSRLLTVFRHSYYELQLTREVILQKVEEEGREIREDDVLWIDQIKKQCQSIEDKIRKLGGDEAVVELHKPPPTRLNVDQIVRDVMESEEGKEAMARDYWKQFGEEIAENNFDKLYELLEEVSRRLCSFVPNRVDIHTEIGENIDVPFIKQKIENGVFDGVQFRALVLYIIDKVKQFGPPVEDNSLDKWKEEYFEGMGKERRYTDLLPPFFNEVLRRFDRIEESIAAFRRATSSS